MVLLRPVPALLFGALLLAGCSADPRSPADADEPSQDQDPLGVVASFQVLANGTALEAANGTFTATVGMDLSFDASSSQGTNLTYEWDFDDGTKGSGQVANHSYQEAGLRTVGLRVIGRSAFNETSLVLNVTTGGPPPGTLLHTQVDTFGGSLPLGNPNSPTTAGTDYNDHVVTLVETTPNGTGSAKAVRITLDGSGDTAITTTLYWRSPDGTNLQTVGGQFPPTGQSLDQSLEFNGDMPPGDYVIRVRLNTGADYSYTVTSDVDYVAP